MRLCTVLGGLCVWLLVACSSNRPRDTVNPERDGLDASSGSHADETTSTGVGVEDSEGTNTHSSRANSTGMSAPTGSVATNVEPSTTAASEAPRDTSECMTAACARDAGQVDYDPCDGGSCGQPCSLDPDSNDECLANGAPDTGEPQCKSVDFVSTDAACVEESWIWDGSRCHSTTHCGCSAGDCDQIYADYKTCKAAHQACLPNACQPEDARSNGTMCGTTYGYAFDGYACNEVICGCTGADCAAIADTEAECLDRFTLCLNRTPECFDDRFPVTDTDPGSLPTYPEFGFSVAGYADLYEQESGSVALFADWTAARWIGWEEAESEINLCPAITGFSGSWRCPYAEALVLEADGETYQVNVSFSWDFPLLNRSSFVDVAIKIEAHPSGTLVLRIRDEVTGLPVLMVAQSMLDVPAQAVPWEFAPFTFTRKPATDGLYREHA